MFLLKRISPYLIGLITLVGLEILLENPEFIWWLPVAILGLVLSLVFLICKKPLGLRGSVRFLLTFFLFFVANILCLLFLESFLIKQLLIVLTSLILTFYLEYLFLFLYLPEKYKTYSLENLSNFVNLLSFLFLSIAVFAFIVFMNLKWCWAVMGVFLISLSLLVLSFAANKIEISSRKKYLIIGSLLVLEIFIVLTWLPFTFYLKALLLTSFYYLINGVFKLVLLDNVSGWAVSRFVLVTVGVWIFSFITARWT